MIRFCEAVQEDLGAILDDYLMNNDRDVSRAQMSYVDRVLDDKIDNYIINGY